MSICQSEKTSAHSYAERYSHTGYTVATTHAPQFGPNVIMQDNTWELTREIKLLPQPFVNPVGAASIRSIKFLIPPVVAETWIPSECSLSLSYDVNKPDVPPSPNLQQMQMAIISMPVMQGGQTPC